MANPTTQTLNEIALALYDCGAVQIDGRDPDRNLPSPVSPLPSPISVDLRTSDHPEKGPLTREILARIAEAQLDIVNRDGIRFTQVLGVPGDADALAEQLYCSLRNRIPISFLRAERPCKENRFTGSIREGKPRPGKDTLVVAGVFTFASNIISTIELLRDYSICVSAVVSVVSDGCTEPEKLLRNEGVAVSSLFTALNLAAILRDHGRINCKTYRRICGPDHE